MMVLPVSNRYASTIILDLLSDKRVHTISEVYDLIQNHPVISNPIVYDADTYKKFRSSVRATVSILRKRGMLANTQKDGNFCITNLGLHVRTPNCNQMSLMDDIKMIPSVTDLNSEKIQNDLFDDDYNDYTPQLVRKLHSIRKRNTKAVKKLKDLYNHECQVTGTEFTFEMKNGHYYSEGHHIVPLGLGGADSVWNIVVLSPMIHRMLHYANVGGLYLSKINNDKLSFQINSKDYTLKYHPDHGKIVKSFTDDSALLTMFALI